MPQITITQTPLRFGAPEPQKAPISPKRVALMKRYARACQLELRSRQAKTVGGKGRDYDWSRVGRPNQLAPPGNWSVWLLMAGRGFGKSRSGAEWVRAAHERVGRIALVAPTAADARDVMVEGESGLLAISPPWDRPIYEPSKRRVTWPNGSIATLYSADEPERLRGPQHGAAWCDELGCLTASSIIATEHGEVKLKDVKKGDLVWTRSGLRRVIQAGITNYSASLWCLDLSDGRSLVGTASHPVFVPDQGFTPLRLVPLGVILETWKMSSSGMAGNGNCTKEDTTAAVGYGCTRKSIKKRLGLYRTVITSTTGTKIQKIIAQTTWWHYLQAIIYASTGRAGLPCGIQSVVAAILRTLGGVPSLVFASAPIVEKSSYLRECGPSSATLTVRWPTTGVGTRSPRRNAPDALRFLARIVVNSLAPQIRGRCAAPKSVDTSTGLIVVSVRPLGIKAPVYNLEVEGDHEYYANGILVHNSWRYPEAWDMLMFGLRLGQHPQVVVTTTPRPIKIVKDLLARAGDDVVVTRASTYENRDNLPEAFFAQIVAKYEGTRLGRQELDAELLEDVPGALWSRALIEAARVRALTRDLERVVVAVDPAVSSEEGSDETGIVVVGRDREGHGYVLADASGRYTPREWAEVVIGLYRTHAADRVVAEVNQGGAMVEATLRMVDPNVPFTAVRATRGKVVRAEPVAALYEQSRVHHLGFYPQLEDQMVEFTSDFDKARAGYSPDRVDAMVWGFSDLLVEAMPFEGLMRWYQQQAEARG